jgi:hypothetical protein
MLDHMTLRVADIARTHAICVAGPSPHGGPPGSVGRHLAWRAPDRAAVDAFHHATVAAGGRDNGPPGLCAHDRRHCHGAVVIGPEGNNVEAMCHGPA